MARAGERLRVRSARFILQQPEQNSTMSKQYDPRGKIEVWLSAFDSFPSDQRPTFVYRRLSAAEYDRMAEQYDCVPRPKADSEPAEALEASRRIRAAIMAMRLRRC